MTKKRQVVAADLGGFNRLTIAGIAGVVDLVEAMHYNVASVPGVIARPKRDRASGITCLVCTGIHGVRGDYVAATRNPRLAEACDESRQWVGYGINHLDLLCRPEVYAQIRRWLAEPA
jgi:hypothetical protein